MSNSTHKTIPLAWRAPDGAKAEPTFDVFLRGWLEMLDQTLLPTKLTYLDCRTIESIWEGIKALRVRGAPAIGIAAAYGVCVGMQSCFRDVDGTYRTPSEEGFFRRLDETTKYLATSRPTAVNLFWALDRMKSKCESLRGKQTVQELAVALLTEALAIHSEDIELCRAMGRYGAELTRDGGTYLTHCNAGGLATGQYGTALAVFYWSHEEEGKRIHVYADETRPLLQGARLTAWELTQNGVETTVICDSMAATVMRQGKIDAVFVGADRITSNGDTANKIGTYMVALCARAHNIPFYVVAPRSTFDLTLGAGEEIPIEERDACEIGHWYGKQTAPDEAKFYNPAFDVTPAELITGIVTENGLIAPVTCEMIEQVVGQNRLVSDINKDV
ncbi:MAG: S-methyl-5-thioribose-1-phosphate isomerase [Planctomycetia bacterium]|nr:S-methyl-5-thioribose-1-phosphate isomerase [Planctomycetia bacterium]